MTSTAVHRAPSAGIRATGSVPDSARRCRLAADSLRSPTAAVRASRIRGCQAIVVVQ